MTKAEADQTIVQEYEVDAAPDKLWRAMAEGGVERRATFYYGARTAADLCFEKEIADLRSAAAGEAADDEAGHHPGG